jgi:O-antigen ligase
VLEVKARAIAGPAGAHSRRGPLDVPELLFLAAAVVAPLNLLLVASFSVYDLLMIALAFFLYFGPRTMQPLPRELSAAACVFVACAMVSTFRATHPVESMTQLVQFVLIFFVQIPVVLTMAASRLMLRASLLLFMGGSLLAVLQALVTQRAQGADRVLAFFSDNPNRLGYLTSYLVPFVVFFLGALWRSGRRRATVVAAAVLTYLLVWPLTASASRGATIGTIVAIVVYVALRPGLGWRRVVGGLVLSGALVWGFGWVVLHSDVFPATLQERLTRTLDPEERSTLVGDRESLAVAGLRAFEDSPLVGTGLDNFRYVAVLYEPSASNQAPHNLWIQLLAQVGLVGTLAFAFILARWFGAIYGAFRAVGGRGDDATLAWAFVAAMASIMAILMTTPTMNQRHYWFLYGLGMALVAGTPRGPVRPAEQVTDQKEWSS